MPEPDVDAALAEVLALVYATADPERRIHWSLRTPETILRAIDGIGTVLRKNRSQVITLGVEALLRELRESGTLRALVEERERLTESDIGDLVTYMGKRVTSEGLK